MAAVNRPASSQRPLRDHVRVIPGTRNASAALQKEQEFDDAKLMALLQSAGKDLQGIRLVHLHLSLLQNIDLADTTLILRVLAEVSANSGYVQMFRISNGDIIMFYKAVKFSAIEEACRKIEANLLAKTSLQGVNPYREPSLYSILELSMSFVQLMRYLEALAKPAAGAGYGDAGAKPAITPEELAKIDADLGRFDLSPYMFNQAVVNLRETDEDAREYYEIYISIADLQAKLSPDFDLMANRWLFRHFSVSLDRSLLRTLKHGLEFIGKERIGLNMNLTTVLSPAFQRFDEHLPATFRGRVVIEINKGDLMENLHLYRSLLTFAARNDYKICLDGLDTYWATHFDLEALGCDYAKVFWSTDMMTMEPEHERPFLDKVAASRLEGARCKFILARCGAVTGLGYASKNGIDLVQGHAVDAVLRKGIRVADAISTALRMDG